MTTAIADSVQLSPCCFSGFHSAYLPVHAFRLEGDIKGFFFIICVSADVDAFDSSFILFVVQLARVHM